MDGFEEDVASQARFGCFAIVAGGSMEKWVEATEIQVGPVSELPSEEAAWQRVEELGLPPSRCCPHATDLWRACVS